MHKGKKKAKEKKKEEVLSYLDVESEEVDCFSCGVDLSLPHTLALPEHRGCQDLVPILMRKKFSTLRKRRSKEREKGIRIDVKNRTIELKIPSRRWMHDVPTATPPNLLSQQEMLQ